MQVLLHHWNIYFIVNILEKNTRPGRLNESKHETECYILYTSRGRSGSNKTHSSIPFTYSKVNQFTYGSHRNVYNIRWHSIAHL